MAILANLLILFLALSANATLSNFSFKGYSRLDQISSKYVIYGGAVGDGTVCTANPLDDTCNNCLDDTITPAAQPKACNPRRILASGRMYLSFSSDKVGGTPTLSLADTAATRIGLGPAVEKGSVGTVNVDWGSICNAIEPTAISSNCEVGANGKKDFYIGIDADNNGDLAGTTDEKLQITIYLQRTMCDVDICPESGCTGVSVDLSASNCALTDTTVDDGIYSFEVQPGDSKVYLGQLVAPTGFATTTNGLFLRKLRLYYTPGDATCATAGTCCGSFVNKIRNSSPYFDLNLAEQSTGVWVPSTNKFNGLQNDQYYLFKLAAIDDAGNVGLFTPDEYCVDSTASTNYGLFGIHKAFPGEVTGFLSQDQNCFIATAAFGSVMDKHVQTFRDFRDTFLANKDWGRTFIQFYYAHSPRWAAKISQSENLKTIVRGALWPLWGYAWLSLKWGAMNASLFFVILLLFPILAVRTFRSTKRRQEAE